MRHVNIAGHMVLGSSAYFPHLTFAYISICQAQHAALQLFTHGHNELRGQGCAASVPARGWCAQPSPASWPCSTLCCSAADMAQEAIFTAQLALLGSGNTNPFPNPSWKRGSKETRCVLFKVSSLGTTFILTCQGFFCQGVENTHAPLGEPRY